MITDEFIEERYKYAREREEKLKRQEKRREQYLRWLERTSVLCPFCKKNKKGGGAKRCRECFSKKRWNKI